MAEIYKTTARLVGLYTGAGDSEAGPIVRGWVPLNPACPVSVSLLADGFSSGEPAPYVEWRLEEYGRTGRARTVRYLDPLAYPAYRNARIDDLTSSVDRLRFDIRFEPGVVYADNYSAVSVWAVARLVRPPCICEARWQALKSEFAIGSDRSSGAALTTNWTPGGG